MEVLLKKTKITKSIIEQSFKGSWSLFYNWEDYQILGFCVYNKTLTPVLYDESSNRIIIMDDLHSKTQLRLVKENVQLYSDTEKKYKYLNLYRIYIDFSNRPEACIFTQDKESDEEVEEKFKNIHTFITILNEKGQFYI